MIVEFSAAAVDDVWEVRQYYEAQREGLGLEFCDDLEAKTRWIGEHPEVIPTIAPNVRCIRLKRFPYGVYYRIHLDRIEVLGVIHLRRRATAWRSRLG